MAICKGCGKAIIWGETSDGKKIPLDPVPPVYFVEHFTDAIEEDKVTTATRCEKWNGESGTMVSHFITCPERDRFSGSRKKEG